MANPYFRNIPEFAYVNRDDPKSTNEYSLVKNFFKRAKLRDDIFENVAFFEKFIIKGDDRPDNVAFQVYGDPTLDWVVLMSNNIVNVQSEWPLSNENFYEYLIDKYENETKLYSGIHHYEANEVKTSNGRIIIESGTRVSVGQSVSFYDKGKNDQVTITDIALPVTNFTYEQNLNNKKREIFLLKKIYLNIVFDDLEQIMSYKEGSTQYVSETLVQGDNIRLFD
tara:strand:+ start:1005 stop:1676 length:672 start_codon:yes stop_codon:yes gene_type:complete